jgi:hypothetical protein
VNIKNNQIYVLAKDKSPTDVKLKSSEWAIITQVDGEKTVKEIAETLALKDEEAFALFEGLIEKGLIGLYGDSNPEEQFVSDKFFEVLKKEFIDVVGPVAPFIISDVFLENELKKDKLKQEMIPELIELLSDEITDEKKKVKFQQKMLNYLKEIS